MAEIVRMPKLSDTMTDGVIAKWHKKVGDKVDVTVPAGVIPFQIIEISI